MTMVAALVLAAGVPAAADTYTGSLTSADGGGIDGREQWIDPGPSSISWAVSWDEVANAWHYAYTFTVPEFAISHMIIEVSDDFTLDDIWEVEGQHTEISLGTYEGGSGNPNMPGFIYGIKLDGYIADEGDPGYTAVDFSFLSRRNPVWADFYAKCGGRQGFVNEAWNAGLTEFEDDDPLVGPTNGSIDNHILAPNGYVPEPATTALFGLGIASLIGTRLRRRREG